MKLIIENWRKWICEQSQYGTMAGDKYVIDLKRMNIVASDHGEDQRHRHMRRGKGKISKDSIMKAIEVSIGKIMNDFANGEIKNGEPFHIKAKQGNQEPLNIIAALDVKPGPDDLVIITVMRKKNFQTDDKGFEGRPQKTYSILI